MRDVAIVVELVSYMIAWFAVVFGNRSNTIPEREKMAQGEKPYYHKLDSTIHVHVYPLQYMTLCTVVDVQMRGDIYVP